MEIITSPSATGGTGPDFEFKVGAACLTLLLTGGAPFFLETGTVNAVHFQTKYLGWQTDDLLLEAVDGQGEKHKAAIQVKRSFVLSEKDKESTEALRRAFADFRNASLFNQGRDMPPIRRGTPSAPWRPLEQGQPRPIRLKNFPNRCCNGTTTPADTRLVHCACWRIHA